MSPQMAPVTDSDPQTSSPAIAEAMRWGRRTRFNPLASLTASSLTRSLDSFDRGDLREAAVLWDSIANRDDTIPSVKAKREKSIAHKTLETVPLEASDAADEHRDVLESFWRHVRYVSAWDRSDAGGVQKLIRRMQEAVSYRYAVHHIVWRPTAQGLRATFEYVPLWFFEAREARLRFLPSGYGLDGLELDSDEWLISSGDGLMIAASIGYFCKRATLQDWLRFSEKFSQPGVLGRTSAGKGTPEGEAMRQAVSRFGNEWAAVLYGDDGSKKTGIELVQANGNPAAMPMPALIERVDRKISALYRGADLSTMSAGSGEGTGASLQSEEQDILERADAAERSEELQRVERTVIRWHFGEDAEPLAQTRLIVPEREDQQLLLDAVKTFVDLGANLSTSDTLGRYGLSEASGDEATLERRARPGDEPRPAARDDAPRTPAPNALAEEVAEEVADELIGELSTQIQEALVDGLRAGVEAVDPETAAPDDGEAPGDEGDDEASDPGDSAAAPGSDEVLTSVLIAPNAEAVSPDEDGWYQIAPYGEWPTVDGRHLQVFGREQAEKMVRHYNSLPFRITRWLSNREVPVFIGHPDVDRRSWPDERKLATKHRRLEAREDGLWGQAAWNGLGRDNLENGYWQYPSPVWLYKPPQPGTNRVYPDLLQSVGLTNFQNTPHARRVTANAVRPDPDAAPSIEETTMKELIAELGLEEGASEEDILAAVRALKQSASDQEEKAAKAEEDTRAANAARDTAETALAGMRETAANGLLDTAVESGAITLAEKTGWQRRFEADYEAAANALAEVKPADGGLNRQPVDLPDKPTAAPSTARDRIAAVNSAVQAEMTRNGGDYDRAHAAVKADPKMRPIFDAMAQASDDDGED